jgi:hypothetical protein
MTRHSTRKTVTKFKSYLLQNNIEQLEIRDWTKLSMGAINKLVGTGEGNDSTKKLVMLFLQTKDESITEDSFKKLLKLIPNENMYRKIK